MRLVEYNCFSIEKKNTPNELMLAWTQLNISHNLLTMTGSQIREPLKQAQ